jgi:hypothetical protein
MQRRFRRLARGEARIWIYRDYLASESLNPATVSINGAVTGYAQAAGGVFCRDVPPGPYLVTVDGHGRDTNQSANAWPGCRCARWSAPAITLPI